MGTHTFANPRVPKKIIKELKDALEAAEFKDAEFGDTKATLDFGYKKQSMILDELLKSETQLYRETYLIPVIKKVLDWAEGK